MFPSACLSACLPACLLACLSVCLSVCMVIPVVDLLFRKNSWFPLGCQTCSQKTVEEALPFHRPSKGVGCVQPNRGVQIMGVKGGCCFQRSICLFVCSFGFLRVRVRKCVRACEVSVSSVCVCVRVRHCFVGAHARHALSIPFPYSACLFVLAFVLGSHH